MGLKPALSALTRHFPLISARPSPGIDIARVDVVLDAMPLVRDLIEGGLGDMPETMYASLIPSHWGSPSIWLPQDRILLLLACP